MIAEKNEIIKLAHSHVDRGEFNEALALLEELLEELPEAEHEEVESLKYFFEVKRAQHLDELHGKAEQARDQGGWDLALKLVDEAREIDREGKDERFSLLARHVLLLRSREEEEGARAKKKQRVRNLLDTIRSLADVDVAIKHLEEMVAKEEDDPEILNLLDSAKELRREFLARMGQITTLEEGEQFEDAIREVNNLIQQGWREFEGQDIYEYRSSLEAKAISFADQKASKYLVEAQKALTEQKPELALSLVQKGLDLPFVPQKRKEDLNDFQLRAEQARKDLERLEATVQQAVGLMNRDRDFEQAIGLLEGVLASLPDHQHARLQLDRGRQGLQRQQVKEVRSALASAEARLKKKRLTDARTQLEVAADALEELDGQAAADALRGRYEELLTELDDVEAREERIQEAESELRQALAESVFAVADDILDSLSPEIRKDSRISRLRSQLSRKQDVDEALAGARQALEDEDFEGARKQMQSIRRRRLESEEIPDLSTRVEASFHFDRARSALTAGDLTTAKRAFNQVRKIGDVYAEDADDELQAIAELQEKEKKEKQLFSKAEKHKNAGRLEEAYRLLEELGDDPGQLRKQILQLRSQVSREWRKDLGKETRDKLKAEAYEDAFQVAEKLAAFKMGEDTRLISQARLAYHRHRAQTSARGGDWHSAVDQWLEAEKYDPGSEEIAAGLKEAKCQKALHDARTMADTNKRIALLESVLDPHQPDAAVYERLAHELIRAGEYRKAKRLAEMSPGSFASSVAVSPEALYALCQELEESQRKLELGSYSESIEVLQNCRNRFSDFASTLDDVLRRRRQEAVESLWSQALRLENEGQKPAHTLPVYQELLVIEPSHSRAQERNKMLLDELDHHIDDLLHVALLIEEEDNAFLTQVEEKIQEIDATLKVANKDQIAKLNIRREKLNAKRRILRTFEEKEKLLRTLLAAAKETGDFNVVDGLQAEVANLVPNRFQRLQALKRDIGAAREGRRRAENLAAGIDDAHRDMDFDRLDKLAAELRRHDPDDDFQVQEKLRLIDSMSQEPIVFADLSEWARERHQNVEKLSGWLEARQPRRPALEEKEEALRSRPTRTHDRSALIAGLERLAAEYGAAAGRLEDPPMKPLSPRAAEIAEEAREIQRSLNEQVARLEGEAQRIEEEEEQVRELIEQASRLIDIKDHDAARPIIELGLDLVPDHEVLKHFLGIISHGK